MAGLAKKLGVQSRPLIRNLSEFLEHGIQYAFVPERGALQRSVVIVYVASPLNSEFSCISEAPPVWPGPEGTIRGEAFSPFV